MRLSVALPDLQDAMTITRRISATRKRACILEARDGKLIFSGHHWSGVRIVNSIPAEIEKEGRCQIFFSDLEYAVPFVIPSGDTQVPLWLDEAGSLVVELDEYRNLEIRARTVDVPPIDDPPVLSTVYAAAPFRQLIRRVIESTIVSPAHRDQRLFHYVRCDSDEVYSTDGYWASWHPLEGDHETYGELFPEPVLLPRKVFRLLDLCTKRPLLQTFMAGWYDRRLFFQAGDASISTPTNKGALNDYPDVPATFPDRADARFIITVQRAPLVKALLRLVRKTQQMTRREQDPLSIKYYGGLITLQQEREEEDLPAIHIADRRAPRLLGEDFSVGLDALHLYLAIKHLKARAIRIHIFRVLDPLLITCHEPASYIIMPREERKLMRHGK